VVVVVVGVGQETESSRGCDCAAHRMHHGGVPVVFYFGFDTKMDFEEEEEPYLKTKNDAYLVSFVPLYPTYRSCIKKFRPPIFRRNRYP
jgi:hypothetical protein